MESDIVFVRESADRVYGSLCSYLRRMQHRESPRRGDCTSITRVMLRRCEGVQLGSVTFPLEGVPEDVLRRTFQLSPTQAKVAILLGARLTNEEIAGVLGCREGTVRSHVGWVYTRLGVRHRKDVAYVLADASMGVLAGV